MKKIALVFASLLGLAAGPVAAQDLPEIADTDSNGIWSLAELQTAFPDLTEEGFAAIDANKDGGVDEAELTTALATGALVAKEG